MNNTKTEVSTTEKPKAEKPITGVVINKLAQRGITMIYDAVRHSAGFKQASVLHQSAPALMMQGLCIAVNNGVGAQVALEEARKRKDGDKYFSGMWASDASSLALVAHGVDSDLIVTTGSGEKSIRLNVRSLMVGKPRKDKTTQKTLISWPSLQGVANKIRDAEKQVAIESATPEEKSAMEKTAKIESADVDMKRARSTISHFKSLSASVRNLALSILADEDSQNVDIEKAKVLRFVADAGPRAIGKYAELLGVKL